MPQVSVVLPTLNPVPNHLREALESLRSQDLEDIEILIMDGGSGTKIQELVRTIQKEDSRIKFTSIPGESLIDSLNRGFRAAQASHVARMDADDICDPHRLSMQSRFLDDNPGVVAVGSFVQEIAENGDPLELHKPCVTAEGCKWVLFFATCIFHPAAMIRKNFFNDAGGYRGSHPHAEDYDLFARLSAFGDIVNLPKVLLKRRLWHGNVGKRHRPQLDAVHQSVMKAQIEIFLGDEVEHGIVEAVRFSQKEILPPNVLELNKAADLVRRLHAKSLASHTNPQARYEINTHAARLLAKIARQQAHYSYGRALRTRLIAAKLAPELVFKMAKKMTYSWAGAMRLSR